MLRGIARAAALLLTAACAAQSPAPSASPAAGTITMPQAPGAFDHAVIDDTARLLFLADRSNAAVDVFTLTTETFVARIGGFHTGGPNGLELVPDRGELWAADADSSVRVIDVASRTIVATIATNGRDRTDDLAYDAKDKLIVVGNDSEPTPFLTFISTVDRRVLGRLEFPGALGLEEVHWRAARDIFYQAIPATNANGGGEIDAIDPVAMKVSAVLRLSDCGPHGIALGPGDDVLAGCGASHALIVDAGTGATLATFPQIGGADIVWYDPKTSQYLVAGSGTGAGTSVRGSAIGVIDADARAWIEDVPTATGAHCVIADPRTGRIYVPIPREGLRVIEPRRSARLMIVTSASNGGAYLLSPPMV